MPALGLAGIDKSKVSRIYREPDEGVAAFCNPSLDANYPGLCPEAARRQMTEVLADMEPPWPKAAAVLVNGKEEVLTCLTFPIEYWTRIYLTPPLQRLNHEVKRRTDVVSISPDADTALLWAGSILIEGQNEWQA